jgi:predicted metal-dependent phosphoesterase TrpH
MHGTDASPSRAKLRAVVRVDLHVHSSASSDCTSDPERVAARCSQLGLSPVFLTDHNTLSGAALLQSAGSERIIAGEEVMTADGELIGLFLKRPIQSDMTPLETALKIKDQGGLVYLEHPYDPLRRHLSEAAIEAVANLVDIVEVFNGRSDEHANRLAADLCDILGAAPGAGSDAHKLTEIGSVYIEMADFDGAQDFLAKLRNGRIVKGRLKPLLMLEARLRRSGRL